MAIYAKGNNEHTHVMEDSKDNSTQKICVEHVSEVVQALVCAYTFQKRKATTQDDGVLETKKTTISSVSYVNEGELNPNPA
jgi:hypothetical protein